MSLKDQSPANTYKRLLNVNNSNGIDSTVRRVEDGIGNKASVSLNPNKLLVKPSDSNNTDVLRVDNLGGTELFKVDATNSAVKALQKYVNTQYANFAVNSTGGGLFAANTHQAMPFNTSYGFSDISNPPAFGTGEDPATSFTTAEGGGTRASDLTPAIWYITDNIVIDKVCSLEGADTATGDTTRMHLMSYDFTSGSTSALSNGALLASNSDVTNAGSEQIYYTDWSIASASVSSGKVILAFFRSDSINSDYSVQVNIKYHLA
tara:strand:+ start:10133 stop:10921 length:789 start_codon:yes stop_codon:yes gene_type:complete